MLWFLDLCFRLRGRYEKRYLGEDCGWVKDLPFGLIIKFGKMRTGSEADTLRYIRKHTTIPVPRVYASAEKDGRHYTLMKCIDGIPLECVWDDLTSQQRSHIVSQLHDYVAQLRTLKPPPTIPPGSISSLYGKPYLDARLSSGHPVGPFLSEAAFNDFLIDVASKWIHPELTVGTRRRMRDDHRIVFTHGDLAPRNILVKGGKVVALIDWEESGWMPEHWELVKAMWFPAMGPDSTWNEAIFDFITREHENDWKVDRELSDYMVGAI